MKGETRIIGIAGGIGSGKSMVSRVLRLRGYRVYDCDFEAKKLMATDKDLRRSLTETFGCEVIDNPKALAAIVFGQPKQLQRLNSIVHPAVKDDLKQHARSSTETLYFVESAILASSGIGEMCDAVCIVETPLNQRIHNVQSRQNLSRQEILDRIKAQQPETQMLDELTAQHFIIRNTAEHSLLHQIDRITELLKTQNQH